jgi:hypothetical protein
MVESVGLSPGVLIAQLLAHLASLMTPFDMDDDGIDSAITVLGALLEG